MYDAATRPAVVTAYEVDQTANSFDGDGQVIKQIKSTYNEQTQTYTPGPARYFIRSLVLQGQVVSETHPEGQKLRTLIPADGSILAWQYKSYNPPYPDEVKWEHREPSGASFRSTSQSGGINYGAGEESPAELDPMNADVKLSNPYIQFQPEPGTSYSLYPSYGTPGYQSTSYSVDGMPVSADRFMQEVNTWFGSGFGFGLLFSNQIVSRRVIGHWVRTRTRVTYTGSTVDIEGEDMPSSVSGIDWAHPTVNRSIIASRPAYSTEWAFSNTLRLQEYGDLSDLTSNIRIIDTGGSTAFERNKRKVLDRIAYMMRSTACSEAFKRAGLSTPFELVTGGHITLSSRFALTDSSYNKVLGIPDSVRNEALGRDAPAQTIRNDTTGNSVTFYGADAFADSYDISEDVVHEFIHAAGIKKVRGFGWLDHDLRGYKFYDDIIANCRLQ